MDSAYVGFIFLIITEFVLIKLVTSSHTRSIERELKYQLDNGNSVDLSMREYGPLRINRHMKISKMLTLMLPSVLIIAMVSFGELGISGTTIQTTSVQKTIRTGKYFALDALPTVDYSDSDSGIDFTSSPNYILGHSSNCIEYSEDGGYVTAREAIIPYSLPDSNGSILEIGEVLCSEKDGVIASLVNDKTGDRLFHYNITSLGSLIYFADRRAVLWGPDNGDVSIYMGKVTIEYEVLKGDEEQTNIFWVENNLDFGERLETCAIIDVSGNSENERWVLDTFTERSYFFLSRKFVSAHFASDAVIIECEEGCFESIVQWCLLDREMGMEQIETFFSIWYDGLNYGDDKTTPRCERIPAPIGGSSVGTNTTWLWGDDYSEENLMTLPPTPAPVDPDWYVEALENISTPSPTVLELEPTPTPVENTTRSPFHFEYRRLSGDFAPPFKTVSCEDAVSTSVLPDGGVENVTEVSIWAICFIVLGFIFSIVHYIYNYRCQKVVGYDILSYEGISKICYMDANPGCDWNSGGPLTVSIIDGKVSSRILV